MRPNIVDDIVLQLYDMVLQRPLDSYKTDALAALAAALPFDSAIWASGAHSRNLILSIATPNIRPDVLLDYALNWQPHDALRAAVVAHGGRALRNEDIMAEAEHRASAIYRGFCAPNGMDFTLGIALADPVTTVGELVFLFRHAASGPFDDGARDLLQAVAPHLFAAWRQRQSLGLWSRQSSAAPQPLAGYAVIDDGGLVHAADADFGTAVLRAVPGWVGPVLPDRLRAMIARGRSPLRLAGQRFALRRGSDGRHLLLALASEAEALTQAERRTARLYAAGASHAGIAAQLGLAPATVRNQLAAVYRKLDVHTKVALAAALQGIPD
jgi:DNA-binding CsgD family transcriptional regulator